MSDICFECLKILVMVAVLVLTRYVLPWVKAIVTQFLKEILQEKNIALSDKQIEILIEAAVKQMKIQENSGIVIEATDDVEV